ncbi:MAG: hypothetical protein QNJ72_15520 [Pleurocapsa sp. MO_226.B13]|nr:hypothetical protein [Pleurocapsa sp. MO_226.B13]
MDNKVEIRYPKEAVLNLFTTRALRSLLFISSGVLSCGACTANVISGVIFETSICLAPKSFANEA